MLPTYGTSQRPGLRSKTAEMRSWTVASPLIITDKREIKILFELLEKRNEQKKRTIVCSQRDPASWKAMILNDEVSANSIMKRVTKHYTIKINTR